MSTNHDFLESLNARFEAEDAADGAAPEVAEEERDIVPFANFASGGATPREVDGVAFADLED